MTNFVSSETSTLTQWRGQRIYAIIVMATTGNVIPAAYRNAEGLSVRCRQTVSGKRPVNDCVNCVQLNWQAAGRPVGRRHSQAAAAAAGAVGMTTWLTSVGRHQSSNQHRIEHARTRSNLTTAFDYLGSQRARRRAAATLANIASAQDARLADG